VASKYFEYYRDRNPLAGGESLVKIGSLMTPVTPPAETVAITESDLSASA